jgi:hypothetical protein
MTITKNVWKIAALLLVLSLITAAMISGTFARYTSSFAGEDTALVARWEITGSGDGFAINGDDTLTLDLFQHEYDVNVAASADGAYIIAPGVDGEFDVVFTNSSDVAAEVTFNIDVTGSAVNVPIVYTIGSTDYTAAGLEDALNSLFTNVGIGDTETVKVSWSWPLEGNDAGDTALGEASAAGTDRTSYGLVIEATAKQLTPTE